MTTLTTGRWYRLGGELVRLLDLATGQCCDMHGRGSTASAGLYSEITSDMIDRPLRAP